jgi:hypothetical protein
MTHRLTALLGSVADVIRRSSAATLSLLGLGRLGRYVPAALVVLLAIGAVTSAQTTAEVLSQRPEVTRATLDEVAAFSGERGESIWFQFDGLVDSSSFETSADLGTFFYLARDPDRPDEGIIVRSAQGDASFRQRVVGAELTEDPDMVAEALDAIGPVPPGLRVDDARYLVELESGGNPEEAFLPSDLGGEEAGTQLLVAARVVSPDPLSACAADGGCDGEDAAWWYLLADPDDVDAILLRSPHPPDALPVQLQGLYLRETFDLGPVVESDWFRQSGVDAPTDRALRAGSRPPITVEASWLPTILAAALALLILGSILVGYPVFGASEPPAGRRSFVPGERADVELTGRLGGEGRATEVARSPGLVERLSVSDLALLLWRYGLLPRDQSRREAEEQFVAEAGADGDRLLIHERDQSALVVVDRGIGSAHVERGRLHRVGGSVPAVRFRQGSTDVTLAVRSEDIRDRIAAEIAAEIAAG